MSKDGLTLFLFEVVPRSPIMDPMQIARSRVVAESPREALRYLSDGILKYRRQVLAPSEIEISYTLERGVQVPWARSKVEWLQAALLGQVDPPAVWLPPHDPLDVELTSLAVADSVQASPTWVGIPRIEIPDSDPVRNDALRAWKDAERGCLALTFGIIGAALSLQWYWLAPLVFVSESFRRVFQAGALGRRGPRGLGNWISARIFEATWGQLRDTAIIAYLWKHDRKSLDRRQKIVFGSRKTLKGAIFYDGMGREMILTHPEADSELLLLSETIDRLEAQSRTEQPRESNTGA